MSPLSKNEKLERAREVLEGLATGDAIGEALSYQFYRCRELADFSPFAPGSVRYTDDTEMAKAVYETLDLTGGMEEDVVAWAYSNRFRKDPDRGYGKGTRRILTEIGAGADWRVLSPGSFGLGSFGNGAAMRVAPLGAFFAWELDSIPEMAARSARVTHFHAEGIAGAIAVAVAAAVALNTRGTAAANAAEAVWKAVLELTPPGLVHDGLIRARDLPEVSPQEASGALGNGAEVSAQDTVPFCVWSACRNLSDYREAVLSTVGVGGDCDTNAAIVGGIVTAYAGLASIPEDWLRAREVLWR